MGFSIKGLDHVVLAVQDLEAVQGFYCDVLGCTEERRIESIPLIQLRAGVSIIDLVPATAAPMKGRRAMDHFCLRVDPFDTEQLKAELAEKGVRVHEEGIRYGAEGFGPSIYIRDPDGNVVELKGSAEEQTQS